MRRTFIPSIASVESFTTPSGDRVHTEYAPVFNGSKTVLEVVGKTDIQSYIESFSQYTDLNYMLSRLKVGDSSVLSSRAGMYGDFSDLPQNPVEVFNFVHNAQSAFVSLSPEDRSKYNNDYRRWFADILASQKNTFNPGSGSVLKRDDAPSLDVNVKE